MEKFNIYQIAMLSKKENNKLYLPPEINKIISHYSNSDSKISFTLTIENFMEFYNDSFKYYKFINIKFVRSNETCNRISIECKDDYSFMSKTFNSPSEFINTNGEIMTITNYYSNEILFSLLNTFKLFRTITLTMYYNGVLILNLDNDNNYCIFILNKI